MPSDGSEKVSKEALSRLTDPKFYLENFCRIKGKQVGKLIPFILNEAQKDLFNTVNANDRVIILKSRQIGFSTAMVGYFYHKTIMNPGTTTALIGYNSDLTAELLDKVKTFHRTTPTELQPTLHYNSKYEVSFPRLDSKILVLPSTETVGRGYCLHNVLATELAFWEKAEDKLNILEASVPINGKLVIESTPNGIGNTYHRTWTAPDNGYAKKKYGWWWGYTREEIETIRKRMNNPRKFSQEYGLEFLSSGMPVFDFTMLSEMRKGILREGDVVVGSDGGEREVYSRDRLRVYSEPEDGKFYICGVDVAEGVEEGDYTVATFMDRESGEEVAMFRDRLPADRIGDLLDSWGRWYNDALMVVEINNHGLTTVSRLRHLLYPTMYFRPAKFEVMGQPMSPKLGWKTTKVTRPLMIDDLAQACREGSVTLHSKETMDEMMTFVYDEKSMEMNAMEGYHDDTVFSAALCVQGFKVTARAQDLSQLDYTRHLPVSYAY